MRSVQTFRFEVTQHSFAKVEIHPSVAECYPVETLHPDTLPGSLLTVQNCL